MAKLVLLFAVCILPAIASALYHNGPFIVQGKAYCDTCRCGFETPVTKYLAGATVRIECRDRATQKLKYSNDGVTDETGTYNIMVNTNCGDDIAEAVLVKSPDPKCATPDNGRNRARVVVTNYNGMTSNIRYANNMGFLQDEPLPSCPKILQTYQQVDE
ncbi:unnamed protein product [Ilex paraguariensis]|uniref:Uncharacterized protein n=1 Tax=Ilex paraguariensis TaxID=185542 RepID=A0ABC8U1E8_9AQUA